MIIAHLKTYDEQTELVHELTLSKGGQRYVLESLATSERSDFRDCDVRYYCNFVIAFKEFEKSVRTRLGFTEYYGTAFESQERSRDDDQA